MIYFDNAATTRVSEHAAKTALTYMTELYANPSSAHGFGFEAEKALRSARAALLGALGFSAAEGSLIFTGSGTEAAVVAGQTAPVYQGVVVVCDGADSARLRLEITQAVSALTGLSSDKIAVVKRKGHS